MPSDGHDDTHSHVMLTNGKMVSHYRIESKIGAGGMGEVYLAEDTKLKRRVALKFLPAQLAANEAVHARFVREAQILARLNHPNIVGVHEVSEFEGRPYYAMELVEGESLHHYAHEKPLPIDVLIDYAIQICQGLGEAHRAGIVHRDVKAANIAIDKGGRVRLLDFGLATHEGDDKLTKTGSTLGTVSYMSPEQVSGRDIDQRSDLFSLGIVLYELIAGRTPFRRDSEGATLNAIIQDSPEPLSRYKSDVPEKLQDVVMKLLEKDKELRYQTAEGVIADLKRLMYDSGQTARVQTAPPKSKRSGRIIGALAALGLLIIAGAWIFGPGKVVPESEAGMPEIAVLPFDNLGSPDDEYFADGITAEIQSRLAGITGVGVVSLNSAMKYKASDKSLKEIGAELGVQYVVNGTVRWSKVGENVTVRITPQLIRVADDRPLWSENYQRDLMEVFAVQADIATKVVDQLDVTLLQKDRDNLDVQPTDNPEAYALYLKALAIYNRPTVVNPEGSEELLMAIDSAIALDSNFALAYALRSEFYSFRALFSQDTEDQRRAKESAERALELQPTLTKGYIALGMYYNLGEERYEKALELFQRAQSEVHNDPDLYSGIGLVRLRQGRFEESAQNCLKAAELDPLNPWRHFRLFQPYWFGRQFVQAGRALNRAITLEPSDAWYWLKKLELIASQTGDRNQIVETGREALQHCDTLDFLPGALWLLIDELPEIPWREYLQRYKREHQDEPRSNYLAALAHWHGALHDTTAMLAYVDSARVFLEQTIQARPENFEATSALGMAYAVLGDCSQGVKYGRRGKELMPVDLCHW